MNDRLPIRIEAATKPNEILGPHDIRVTDVETGKYLPLVGVQLRIRSDQIPLAILEIEPPELLIEEDAVLGGEISGTIQDLENLVHRIPRDQSAELVRCIVRLQDSVIHAMRRRESTVG